MKPAVLLACMMRLVCYYTALSEVARAVRAARRTQRPEPERPDWPATYSYTVPFYAILIPPQSLDSKRDLGHSPAFGGLEWLLFVGNGPRCYNRPITGRGFQIVLSRSFVGEVFRPLHSGA